VTGPGAPAVGRAAPQFALATVGGDEVDLAGLRGKVVLVNFWATWCVPCKQELPDIDAVQHRYTNAGFSALGVDNREPAATVSSFAAKTPVSFPLLLDPGNAVANAYRLLGLPTSYLLDRDGIVRAIHPGPWSRKELQAAVDRLLAAPTPGGRQ
jgi:peroxiredoxin